MRKISKKVFLNLLKSPSQNEFAQNFQASRNLVGNTFLGEQLVGYSSLKEPCSTFMMTLVTICKKKPLCASLSLTYHLK